MLAMYQEYDTWLRLYSTETCKKFKKFLAKITRELSYFKVKIFNSKMKKNIKTILSI